MSNTKIGEKTAYRDAATALHGPTQRPVGIPPASLRGRCARPRRRFPKGGTKHRPRWPSPTRATCVKIKATKRSGANHLVAGQKPKVDTRLQNVRNGLGHLVLRATCVSKQINEPLLEANLQLVLDGSAADELKVVLDRRKRLGQTRLAMTNGGVRGEETLMVRVKLFALDQSC